jgi:hypothetical protein
MSEPKPPDARKASKDALRAIYYVVIGLALKEALSHAFVKDGAFIGLDMFNSVQRPTTLLFLAFLPTAIRFVQGASIHIDALATKRYKPILDFAGFLVQASFLYLMAITLTVPRDFAWLLILMLIVDTIWLIALQLSDLHPVQNTELQWIVSNVAVICIVDGLLQLDPSPNDAWTITVTAVAAALFDYYLNREFYLPAEKSNDDAKGEVGVTLPPEPPPVVEPATEPYMGCYRAGLLMRFAAG